MVFHPAECRSPQAMNTWTTRPSLSSLSRTLEVPSIHSLSTKIEMTVFLGIKTATTLRTLTKFLNIEKTLPLHATTKQPVLRLAGS